MRSALSAAAESNLFAAVTAAAVAAPSLRAFRAHVLELLAPLVRFDAALAHALSPRVPLETGVIVGLSPAKLKASMGQWDRLAVELEPLRTYALAHGGVASDREALPPRSRARTAFETDVVKTLGMRSLAIAHFTLRDRIIGALLLFRKRADPFTPAELALLRTLVPILSVADAAHTALDAEAKASLPVRLRCVDQRLTDRQRQIVEHVALGHTNSQTASALGLSPNTLRNHLVAIFKRLGAANRADVVRLAVLR